MKVITINNKNLISDYNINPSIRLLAKKYKIGNKRVSKILRENGVTLNNQKGTLKNYKSNSGSFKKNNIPHNKNKKMNTSFCLHQQTIMKYKVENNIFVSPSTLPGISDKISISKLGNKNPMWKGGITKQNNRLKYSREHRIWRKQILTRDKFTCMDCGNNTRQMHAHHIKKFSLHPELKHDINNGICLCNKCHYKTIGKEFLFEKRYLEMIYN